MSSNHDIDTSADRTDPLAGPRARASVGDTEPADLRGGTRGPVGRRVFLKGIGATAVAGAGIASSYGPVGEAEAIPPLLVAGAAGAVGVGAAVGWGVRSLDPLGADPSDETLAYDAAWVRAYEMATRRESYEQSTFIDNENIIQNLDHGLYIEGKIEAIEALNEQLTQQEVEDAAMSGVDSHISTIKENFLKSWNESANEAHNLIQGGVGVGGGSDNFMAIGWDARLFDSDHELNSDLTYATHEFPDGSSMDLGRLYVQGPTSGSDVEGTFDPTDHPEDNLGLVVSHPDYNDGVEEIAYIAPSQERHGVKGWCEAWEDLEAVESNVRSGLQTWVSNVYDSVQSGEIEIADLVTPRERAEMMADEGGIAQAIADLQAMNIPVDTGREVTVNLPHVEGTVRGTLAFTGSETIESGETYHPGGMDGDVYLTYDASLGSGEWSAYEEGIDGGVVTFRSEPFEGVIYQIETLADESVSVSKEDFTPLDSTGDPVESWEDPDRWEADLSDDLETQISEVTSVSYFSENEDVDMQTVLLTESFTVESITDVESGEEVEESLTFESSEPQMDDNYITQEEWDDLQAQNEEIIQRFEDSQDGGGGGGSFLPGFDGDVGIGAIAGGVAVVGVVGSVLYQAAKLYLPGK